MIIGIYKITSPSGKIYIGQSTNIKYRFKRYRQLQCKMQTRLYNSLVKYTPSAHTFEIIEECCVKDLNVRERYFQEQFDVLGSNGLNCVYTDTNLAPKQLSTETKLKMSESAKLRGISELCLINSRKAIKGVKKSESFCKQVSDRMKGKPMSDETKRKLSISKLGSKGMSGDSNPSKRYEVRKKLMIEIDQLTLDGEYVRSFESLLDAYLMTNIRGISNVINGKRSHAGGYVWRRKNINNGYK